MLELHQNRDGYHTPWERWVLRFLIGILMALISWIGLTAIDSSKNTTQAVYQLSTQMAVVQSQISTLNTNVSNVQGLTTVVTQMQVTQTEILRRIAALEAEESSSRRGLK